MFDYPFMVNALEAGTIAALMAAVAGWFMVLRRQSFAGHTLSVMSFPGASGAALIGIPLVAGYFGASTAAALLIAAGSRGGEGRDRSQESAVVGTVQVAGLALGFLFLSLYNGILESLESLLFGSFLGITADQVTTLFWVAVATLLFFAVAGRPLLYASVDPSAASARGVPVRVLEPAFLVVLGLAVAATAQITGVLLVFALLAAPPAAAQQLTARIWLGLVLSALIGLAAVWSSLTLAYYNRLPGRILHHLDRLRRLRRGVRLAAALLTQEFVRNALLAGSAIAVASGAVGYFVVLRAQVFAGDALSHVAFTGVLAAALAGINLQVGLFAATIAVALLFAALGDRLRADDVAIGVIFAWVLGLGVLFLYLFNRTSGTNGVIASRALFGSIFSLTAHQTEAAVLIAAGVAASLAGLARPLLYATIAPQTAAARGVRVGTLGGAFLVLLGIDAGEATQAVGALLLLGLIAAPAGAAIRLTANPMHGLGLSVGFALASIWGGVTAAYLIPTLPPSTAIIGVAVAIYAATFAKP